ncbi:uncharacterized protein FOBCDRAFT_216914, partial [Fusarium oxysporum Fo47]|uniref:uncharacterized protein n=1 Tax=Fusarium oxysporum Fo47 TaxID=660027 RepID=UPI002869B0C0
MLASRALREVRLTGSSCCETDSCLVGWWDLTMSQNMNTLVELMTMGDVMCCAEKLSYAWSLVTRG